MTRLVALGVLLLAALALVYPVVAQSDVTRTPWYSRFKQVAATFSPPNLDAWEQHISHNKINFVDTIPRERSTQLLRTFNAMKDHRDLMNDAENFISLLPSSATFTLNSTGPYAWVTPTEYQATIGGLILDGEHRGDTLSLTTFLNGLNQSVTTAESVDYTARRGDDGKILQFALGLPAPAIGYGCKSGWAVVVADALSIYLQYQRSYSDKARARANPRTNKELIASAQQLLDCATVYEYRSYQNSAGQSVTGIFSTDAVLPGAAPGTNLNSRRPCQGNTLAGALEYVTGRSYAASMPGSGPSRGLNPLSRYGPALSRGKFRGSSDVYQSRGYCAAEQRHSKRFYLDSSGDRGYKDVGDLSVAIGYGVSQFHMELLLNYRQPGRARGRTGPLVSSVYAGSRYFQYYSGGIFQNVEGVSMPSNSCPLGATPSTPVLVMGYYNVDSGTSYWVIRLPFGSSWGIRGSMKLAKNNDVVGIGSVVGVFLPPNYQPEPADALAPSTMC